MSYMEDIISKAQEGLELKKMEMVKQRLYDMGRSDAIDSILHAERFPKVCSVREGNWGVFYVDNGTKKGEFVIAFSDYKFSYESNTVNISFNHTFDKNLTK